MLGAMLVFPATITRLLARFNAFWRHSRALEIVRSLLGAWLLYGCARMRDARVSARVRVCVRMCAGACAHACVRVYVTPPINFLGPP